MITPLEPQLARKRWIGILACATRSDIQILFDGLSPAPVYTPIKRAETGTVMLEGRAGGTGRRFNLGEATVTRCVVQTADGVMGVSYALGHDTTKAEHAAVLDAVLQAPSDISRDLATAIEVLGAHQAAMRETESRKAAATKVNFFTLVRGDD